MEQNRPMDGMACRGVDQETFERVWRRVMPDQAHSPIAMGAAAGERRAEPPDRGETGGEPELRELLELAWEGMHAAQMLARRMGDRGRAMRMLAADYQRALRQLSAAYFLAAGRRYQPERRARPRSGTEAEALRAQFLWEQGWTRACLRGAERVEDPSLQALCRELSRLGETHNRTIRQLLERI